MKTMVCKTAWGFSSKKRCSYFGPRIVVFLSFAKILSFCTDMQQKALGIYKVDSSVKPRIPIVISNKQKVNKHRHHIISNSKIIPHT